MPKQVLLLQKNPARPEVLPLANGNNVFTIAFLMGQFLPTPPSQGDYISSMRAFNKHTEPPFCNFFNGFCPATHICPLFCPPLSCPPLLVISSANSTAYLSNPFPDYDLTYQHYPNHILILCINPILAYYISSYFYPAHFKSYPSFFTLSQI